MPIPNDDAGINATSLAKNVPLTTAMAAYLNMDTTCTRYIPSYGQCGGSAGSCYGTDCLVRAWHSSSVAPCMALFVMALLASMVQGVPKEYSLQGKASIYSQMMPMAESFSSCHNRALGGWRIVDVNIQTAGFGVA